MACCAYFSKNEFLPDSERSAENGYYVKPWGTAVHGRMDNIISCNDFRA